MLTEHQIEEMRSIIENGGKGEVNLTLRHPNGDEEKYRVNEETSDAVTAYVVDKGFEHQERHVIAKRDGTE